MNACRCLVGTSVGLAVLVLGAALGRAAEVSPLPGTAPLTIEGDIASHMIDGADRFLLAETHKALARRARFWNRDFSSPEKYAASVEPNRKRLAHILGVRDPRPADGDLRYVVRWDEDLRDQPFTGLARMTIEWRAMQDVMAEGVLLAGESDSNDYVILLPDPSGTTAGAPGNQVARRLTGTVHVVVPTLVNRTAQKHRAALLTNREFIYRAAYELGRHLIGYEVQQILALVDSLEKKAKQLGKPLRIGVIGHGEGGMIALYAAALDPRINAVCVSGYFNDRRNLWQEPLDHNVFGLLEQFGDAELASLIAPRPLIVEAAAAVESEVPPGTGGGPGKIVTPKLDDVRREFERAKGLVSGLSPPARFEWIQSGDGSGPFASDAALNALLHAIHPNAKLRDNGKQRREGPKAGDPEPWYRIPDPAARQERLVHQLNRHNQQLLAAGAEVRREFFKNLDTSSLEKFQQTVEPYREAFYNDVIGRFDQPLLAPNPRTRKSYDEPKHVGYEVVLDVFPDLIAYGILLVPKDLKPGQRRPVVVCQHGLEGRPQDVIRGAPERAARAYAAFASGLADRGFVTFAPQNPYIFGDRFRTLQRKANPLGKTLFSLIVPQHQQIVNWLGTLPFVDKDRIAFYGLSYGGKTAMRVPPLVREYCLSICSGDFNEWVWKNASVGNRYTYMGTKEYEIFEFDLGSTFNYAEMAALIAPRPFMVERGHFDGVAPDEMVAYEFAKVRHLYQAKLGIGDRCQIEWWVGPHAIHGVGTYAFLHQWLHWPAP